MAATRRFEAVLGGDRPGSIPLIELPFEVREVFGAARPKVVVTVNGVALRTTVSVYGGRSYIGLRKEIRDAAGVAIGERIRVAIRADTEERVVDIPDELARGLARDKPAKQAFDALSYSHRNEYARWVDGARKQDTRARRATRAIEMLRDGVKHP